MTKHIAPRISEPNAPAIRPLALAAGRRPVKIVQHPAFRGGRPRPADVAAPSRAVRGGPLSGLVSAASSNCTPPIANLEAA